MIDRATAGDRSRPATYPDPADFSSEPWSFLSFWFSLRFVLVSQSGLLVFVGFVRVLATPNPRYQKFLEGESVLRTHNPRYQKFLEGESVLPSPNLRYQLFLEK